MKIWIINQEGGIVVATENIFISKSEKEECYIKCYDSIGHVVPLGTYCSERRAKKVFEEIILEICAYKANPVLDARGMSQGVQYSEHTKMFRMPKE